MSDRPSLSRSTPSPFAVAETVAYAMIGAVAEVHRCVPQLVASRRAKWDQQVTLARFLGQMVVNQAQQELRKRVAAATAGSASSRRATSSEASGHAAANDMPDDDISTATIHDTPVPTPPIDHYDELSASQVIERLVHLEPDELDVVYRYESQHRRRRTILGRIDQLRVASGA